MLKFDDRTEYTWCAWDTLFISVIRGTTLRVESTDPETGTIIRLTVTPEGVRNVSPEGAVMSILELTEEMTGDVIESFCEFIFFFPSLEVGRKWVAKYPGTALTPIEGGFKPGLIFVRRLLKEALDMPAE